MKRTVAILVVFTVICMSVAALTLGDVLDKASFETNGFSTKMKMQNVTSDQKTFSLQMDMYVKGKKTRVDMQYTQASFPDPQMFQQMKMLGLDKMRVDSELNGDKYSVKMIYPLNEAYIEKIVSSNSAEAEQLGAFDKAYDNPIEKVGDEEFAGVKCVKYKKILDAKEKTQLKEVFIYINPVNKTYVGQIALPVAGGKNVIEFGTYTFGIKDDVFSVPSGYTKYPNEQVMYAEIMKDLQGK